MQQANLLNKSKKLLFIFTIGIFLFSINSFVYAQTGSNFLSICELLKNKKKYKGKKVSVEGFLNIGQETAVFQFEEGCSVTDVITIETDKSFRDDDFEKAVDLFYLQSKGKEILGFSLRWSTFLRVRIRAEGIFKTSDKPKYGHLNGYKNLLVISDAEAVDKSQLICAEDWH